MAPRKTKTNKSTEVVKKSARTSKSQSTTATEVDLVDETEVEITPKTKFLYYDVKTALGSVPNFNGSPLALNNFLSCCEAALKSVHPRDHEILLRSFQSKCTGDALNFLLSRPVPTHLDEFIYALREKFKETANEAGLRAQLSFLKQLPDEDLDKYSMKAQAIVDKIAYLINVNNSPDVAAALVASLHSSAASSFYVGLRNGHLLSDVRARSPATFTDSVNIAKQIESENRWRENLFPASNVKSVAAVQAHQAGDRRGKRPPPTCWNCGKKGHVQSKCWAEKKPQNSSEQGPKHKKFKPGNQGGGQASEASEGEKPAATNFQQRPSQKQSHVLTVKP